MTTHRTIGFTLVATSVATIIGCSGGAEPSGSANGSPTGSEAISGAAATTARVFSLALEEGHHIDFYELANGQPLVGEAARDSQVPVLANVTSANSLSAVFQAIQPAKDVPPELIAADERMAARPPLQNNDSAPPPDAANLHRGPHFYTAAEQTWFKNTYCSAATPAGTAGNIPFTTVVLCQQSDFGLNSGWWKGGQFRSQSWVGSEAPRAGSLGIYYWTGSSSQLVLSLPMPAGQFYYVITPAAYNSNQYPYYLADLIGPGGNTLISQAIDNCGEKNEVCCGGGTTACDPYNTSLCSIGGFLNICG
jgi:hypothetical protein